MEVFGLLLGLFIIFVLLIAPIWTLVKLYGIEGRLAEFEKRLLRDEKKEPARPEAVAPPKAIPVSPETVRPAKAEPVLPAKAEPVHGPESVRAAAEPAAEPAAPVVPPEPGKVARALENLEARTLDVLRKIWNFLIVGEEFRNPEVTREYAVATTWLIRIGIIVLLCGIGFFLKYSIEHSWLSPAVRVALMVLGGLAMTAVGVWRASGKYRAFMVALAGAGFVTLYLSIMAAYRLYHLIDPLPAFGAMAVVTAAAMTTALGMNALFPALLGCVGGFLTPVFVKTGSHDLANLFLYMTILTAGTLFTAHYRSWILLHLSTFLLYALLGGAAVAAHVSETSAPFVLVLLSIDFAFFSLMALGTARRRDATLLELLLLLANAAFYFLASVPVAQKYYAPWKIAAVLPLWAAGLGVFQAWYASRRIPEARPCFRMFLAAQTAFSLALVVPLLLGGVWIITAWSVLALLLLAMGLRSKSRTLLVMSFLLYAVTQVELFRTGTFLGSGVSYTSVLLHHLLGAGVLTASWTAAAVLLFRTQDLGWAVPAGKVSLPKLQTALAVTFSVIAGVCFFCYSSYEWHLCTRACLPRFNDGVLVLWWSLLILAGVAFYRRRPVSAVFLPVLLILGVLSLIRIVQMPLASPAVGEESYWRHLLTALLTRGIYVVSLTAAGVELCRQKASKKAFVSVLALAGALFFIFSSQEIHTMLRCFLNGFRNGGVSVWWSLCAIALLFSGIRWQLKALRISGVVLFAACAGKVFFLDLAGLDQIWRIAAFAVIGVVTLLGAVLYIRFRDLFTENGKEDDPK